MRTRYLLIMVVLLFIIALGITAQSYFWLDESAIPQAVAGEDKNSITEESAPEKPPQQQMEETVDCAALVAVHESSTRGELKPGSAVFDLISYSLGKAQELALQAGLNKSIAKTRYDEKTVGYFLAYTANPEEQASKNAAKVATCEKQLQQYEPGAQIQSAINKAKAMASESGQPNSNTTTETP